MSAAATISVEVVFALEDRQRLVAVTVPEQSTAAEAVALSGIAEFFPRHDVASMSLGVWGRLIEPGDLLEDGDRIEIYRPLKIDPREARRQLAAEGRQIGIAGDGQGEDDSA